MNYYYRYFFIVICTVLCPCHGPLPNHWERANIPNIDTFFQRCLRFLQQFDRFLEEHDLTQPHAIALPVRNELEQYSSEMNTLFERFEDIVQHIDQDRLSTTESSIENALLEARRLLTEIHQRINTNNTNHAPEPQQPIPIGCTSSDTHPGAPSYKIPVDYLKTLLDMGLSISKIAKKGLLGTKNRKTIYNHCRKLGIKTPNERFSVITDDDLRTAIERIHHRFPNSGSEEVRSTLRNENIHVQRHRVRKALTSVDPVGCAARWAQVTQRRRYSVKSSNSIWHIDNNHALKRWGIYVHGAIDGQSRLISYLSATIGNTGKSSLHLFLHGVQRYGLPSRVRTDHGSEYNLLEDFLSRDHGIARARMLRGQSVHNQRIERLWRDVFCKVLEKYYRLFYYLEDQNLLNIDNPIEMYVLQYVYVPRINADLHVWCNSHNGQGVRTENFQTPSQMWFCSLLEQNFLPQPNQPASVTNIFHFSLPRDDILAQYNIDIDQDIPVVPSYPNPLDENASGELLQLINILGESPTYGMEIYVQVLTFIQDSIIRSRQERQA